MVDGARLQSALYGLGGPYLTKNNHLIPTYGECECEPGMLHFFSPGPSQPPPTQPPQEQRQQYSELYYMHPLQTHPGVPTQNGILVGDGSKLFATRQTSSSLLKQFFPPTLLVVVFTKISLTT